MGSSLKSMLTQVWPPKPKFTEKNLPILDGKVYIVTGSNTGVGKELARILYSKNAKVYMAARSEDKANTAIAEIRKEYAASTGSLVFLHLDLSDLTTIRASVESFLAKEPKLHVLFNNAGVMSAEKGPAKTAQGYEIHIGTNCIGTFMFTELLTPILVATAKREPVGTVRVIWVCSSGTEISGEKSVGISLSSLDHLYEREPIIRYGYSKVGNWLHGVEFAKRYRADGVVSIPLNPGNLASDLFRNVGFMFKMGTKLVTYPPINGAYTELFAGLSPEVTIERSGDWVIPFGRFQPIRADLIDATKSEAEGGNGSALKFWDWTADQTRKILAISDMLPDTVK